MQHVPENIDNAVLLDTAAQGRQQGATLALVTIIGIVVYVVIDVILQLLPPHYKEGRSQFGLVLLGIWTVGAFLLALFPTDIAGQKPTLHGLIHLLVALIAFVCVTLGELLLSLRFAADERWQPVRNLTVTIAFVTLIALFLLFFGMFAGLNGIGGLLERLFLGLALLWILVVAVRLRAS